MQLKSSLASAALFGLSNAALYPGQSNLNHTCQLQTPFRSCSVQAFPNITDSCCTETYGGLVLATQFWSTYTGLESKGQVLPKNHWGIHGLWPDFCNGSYTQYCDLKRQYDPVPSPNTTNGLANGTKVPAYTGPNVGTFLESFGKLDLLKYMNKYWVSRDEPNHSLWAHEFSKHATCFSNFDIPCYGPQYKNHSDVIEYFETAIAFDQQLPTFSWLQREGIVPSNTTKYGLSEIQTALLNGFGARPYVGCAGPRYNETTAGRNTTDNGRTIISEAWYYYHTLGRVQNARGFPVDAGALGGSVSSCARARGALTYPLRTNGSEF